MQWSQYQSDIFDFIEKETGNAIVEAVAGSGKSTTLVEGIKRVPATATSIFLAFNKSIADELKARGVNARTFHSLAFGTMLRHKNVKKVTADKLQKLLNQFFQKADVYDYGPFAAKLVSLAKQSGIGCLIDDIEINWYDIIAHHALELEKENASMTRAVKISRELLQLSNKSALIDFDDMLYLPVLEGISLPKFDFVFVDEAQDTNAIQRALLRKIMKRTSRLIAVGDPAQAIYGFRGADSDSLGLIAEEFKCKTLPLSVSYRCAQSVVEYARNWVGHIQPSESAPIGAVTDLGTKWTLDSMRAQDLVVCRTTRPLVALAFRMLRNRKPAQILGRDIGKGLKTLVKSFKTNDLGQLENRINDWADRETEKAVAKQNESLAASIEDRAQCILMLTEELQREQSDANGLLDVIDKLFSDKNGCVLLMTIHKAKGLEGDRVFWLNSSACPSKWARQEWQKQQERNLCYVATTRAKQQLILIEEESN